jgi:hypothetical protein
LRVTNGRRHRNDRRHHTVTLTANAAASTLTIAAATAANG